MCIRDRAYTGDDALLGNGPYEVTKFDVDAKVVEFTARDDFYMGTPKVKKIVYKTYGTPDTLYMALQNGEVDMIYDYAKGVDTSIIDTFMNDENISTKIVNNTGLPAGVYINTTAAPFDRIEAVSYTHLILRPMVSSRECGRSLAIIMGRGSISG